MSALPSRLTGGCQCGACRYELSAKPLFAYMCHCTECRKQTSSAFSASVLVDANALTLTGPTKSWFRDNENGPPLEGVFCAECGTRLMNHYVPRRDRVRLRMGTLDDVSWWKPAAEFYVSRRMDFLTQVADVQCAEEAGDGGEMLRAWMKLFPQQS
ncbi:MAG: GFA family protein [Hyphomonadaceae bacterium]